VITSTDGPLRGQDQVDAGRARLLREARDQFLDLLADDHHHVGELVDDHDDEGQGFQRRRHARRCSGLRLEQRVGMGGPGSVASRTFLLKPARLRTPTAAISL
jgi:hypothetical protein